MMEVETDTPLREPLLLPEIVPITSRDERVGLSSSSYGAASVAAEYCGFEHPPGPIPGEWAHGWYPRYREKLHPDLILGLLTIPDGLYWVARKDEEAFLRERGCRNARAIGLPLVYLPPMQVRRRPNSLLVMPSHTTLFVSSSGLFDEYVQAIDAIRDEFDEVVVCVHASCFKRGYWVDDFKKRGYPVIRGAGQDDRNSLKRIAHLMSSFEYVTGNGFGSHLAYAAFFGAKPSVYGPFARLQPDDFKRDFLYRHHHDLLEPTLRSISVEALREHCPDLVCHPWEARANVEWARTELGADNRLSPAEMRSAFFWDLGSRLRKAVRARTPQRVYETARMILKPEYRRQKARDRWRLQELRRLSGLARHQPTTTRLLGPPLECPDAQHFLEKVEILFDQERYRFVAAGDPPRILDCGPGIGLSICYFKRLYPKSKITAFEPDPRAFEVCKRNCESWSAGDVELVPTAVWDRETTALLLLDLHRPARLGEPGGDGEATEVRTCRLRDYLDEKVDLLRLNIEGAELEVLDDCADLLGRVENLIVHYHSLVDRPQRLDDLTRLLASAGFRLHPIASQSSPKPLMFRPLPNGMDLKLEVFAFRE
jgi:FkbM family methyltransferase